MSLGNYWAVEQSALDEIRQYHEALAAARGLEMPPMMYHLLNHSVGFISVQGPLYARRTALLQLTGGAVYDEVADIFAHYVRDKETVKEIIMHFNSPGGEVAGCQELAQLIYKTRLLKPVTALVEGQCCSGAYWLAAAAGKVLLSSRTAKVGGIGVLRYRQPEKEAVATGELKAAENRPPSPERTKYIKDSMVAIEMEFLNDLSRFREQLSGEERIKEILTGRTFMGEDAISAGLADGYFSQFAWRLMKQVEETTAEENQ